MTDEDRSKRIADFVDEIDEVCRKHGLGISHEDCQGAFLVVEYAHHEFGCSARDYLGVLGGRYDTNGEVP